MLLLLNKGKFYMYHILFFLNIDTNKTVLMTKMSTKYKDQLVICILNKKEGVRPL